MASTGDPFTLDKFDHTKYDYNDHRSRRKIVALAKDFVKWLGSGQANDIDFVKPKINAFVSLITAGGDNRYDRKIFQDVTQVVPELRINRSITQHPIGPMSHLMYMTQNYRSPAPVLELPETVNFSRGVSRQLLTFVTAQQSDKVEAEMMEATKKAVTSIVRSGTTRSTSSATVLPSEARSPAGATSPSGMTSPSSYRSQIPGSRHIRQISGTAGRANEGQTGSFEELRSRRRSSSIQSAQSFSPTSGPGLTESMGKMNLLPPFEPSGTHSVTPTRTQTSMMNVGSASTSRWTTPLTSSDVRVSAGSQQGSPARTPPGAQGQMPIVGSPQQRGRSPSVASAQRARQPSRAPSATRARDPSTSRGPSQQPTSPSSSAAPAPFAPSSLGGQLPPSGYAPIAGRQSRQPSVGPPTSRSQSRVRQQSLSRDTSVAPQRGRPEVQSTAQGSRPQSRQPGSRPPSAQPAPRRTSSKGPPSGQFTIQSFFQKK